jgi:cysteine-rich repeat protein
MNRRRSGQRALVALFLVLCGGAAACTYELPEFPNTAPLSCGDGIVAGDEQCDDGNINDRDGCTNACELARCGDGLKRTDAKNSSMQPCCDDQPTNCPEGESCISGLCSSPGFEQCDDGNDRNDDLCTTNCQIPFCGDATLNTGESCDDGNCAQSDACTNACQNAACGDGFTQTGSEECDDGGLQSGDGCDDNCQLEACGNGRVDGDEQCDDEALAAAGACVNCQIGVCGDGTIFEGREDCDDGNSDPGDLCSVDCRLDDHGNTPETATQLDLSSEAMRGRRRVILNAAISAGGDVDLFRLTATVAGVYRIETDRIEETPLLDPACEVYDPNGILSGSQNDILPNSNLNCGVEIFLGSGASAYIKISAEGANIGAFDLWVQEPCGNGILDAGEECDSESERFNRFRCRPDCRLRRLLALAGSSGCAVVDGGVQCWGSNATGILGPPDNIPPAARASCASDFDRYENETPVSLHPVSVIPPRSGIVDLSGGSNENMCAHDTRDQQAHCWGRMGDSTTFSSSSNFDANDWSLCAEEELHDVLTWPFFPNYTPGSCLVYPVPYGSDAETQVEHLRGMSLGANAQCIIAGDGEISCWGSIFEGNLGLGPWDENHGGWVAPQRLSLPDEYKAEYVAMGARTGCAILQGGLVACWGDNRLGEAGTGRQFATVSGCSGACEAIPRVLTVDMGTVIQLSMGAHHGCALNSQGRLYCWGANDNLQVGIQSAERCGGIPCVREPQLLPHLQGIADVALGAEHSCVLSLQGTVQCWGNNRFGQLGVGAEGALVPEGPVHTLTPHLVGALPRATAITANSHTSCARTEEGRILCWGHNEHAQAGTACYEAQAFPTEIHFQ